MKSFKKTHTNGVRVGIFSLLRGGIALEHPAPMIRKYVGSAQADREARMADMDAFERDVPDFRELAGRS